MTTKITPDLTGKPVYPHQAPSTEEETEKKAIQTIYAQLKQAACCRDEQNTKLRWEKIEKRFEGLQYRRDKKRIIEKLDDDNNYAPIHYAVRSNNRYVLKKLISPEYKCTVNLLGWDGQAPLHLAACSSEIEQQMDDWTEKKIIDEENSILHILLKNRHIHVNAADDKGRTPLHNAIMRNHVTISNILLNFGAQINIPDAQGATAVHYAYRFGKSKDIFAQFPLHQDLFKLKTIDNKTPFEIAAEYGHLDVVKQYFENQTDTTTSSQGIRSLVHAAVRHHHADILSKLAPDRDTHRYMLNLACRQPNGYEMITDPNLSTFFTREVMSQEISGDGFTPLMVAVKYRRDKCVMELLSDKYCDANVLNKSSNDFERTVLHVCAEFPDEQITDALMSKAKALGIDLAPIDAMGNTPLHICAQKNNLNMCDKLLSAHKNDSNESDKMLRIKNNNGLTALHEAIQLEFETAIARMIQSVSNPKALIDQYDDELRTTLHMAALKGNVKIVDMLLAYKANVHACDVNDHTPLHEAARWSDASGEENRDRIECIEHLIAANAEVNVLNIYRESPLHIACRYSSAPLVRTLLKYDANILQTNTQGFNCLEVAIDEQNTETVGYLIDHEYIFELLRNAQFQEPSGQLCRGSGKNTDGAGCCIPGCKPNGCCRVTRRVADTPMRKLIVTMPDMALKILDKCTTTIGGEKSKIHRIFFDYEFLEDQYAVRKWAEGNRNNPNRLAKAAGKGAAIRKDEPYTMDYNILVMNHPLFLMAVHDRYKLMSHPLSKSLVNQKFYGISLVFFLISFLIFAAFLALFTTVVLRVQHPQYFYNMTGFDLQEDLCQNVTDALASNSIATKSAVDIALKNALYVFFTLAVLKDIATIIGYIRVDWTKVSTFILEIIALGLCYYFIFDANFQKSFTMRCPLQWQLGAAGLFIGYMALLYYVQYVPIFGIYVIMLKQIIIRFLLFVPVLFIFIFAFGVTVYMIFQNFRAFTTVGFSIAKILMMLVGEIGYDDLINNDATTAYYQISIAVLIILAVIMTILISNLLIGLAVGEIGPMMDSAKDTRLDMLYELAADFEILKYRCVSIFARCCGRCFLSPRHYKQSDLTKQNKCLRKLKKRLLESCAREYEKDELSEPSDDENELPRRILDEVRKGIEQMNPSEPSSGAHSGGPSKAVSGTKFSQPAKK